MPYLDALIMVQKDMALRGNQRSVQIMINLMRELDLLKPKEEFSMPEVHIHFVKPGDKINE